MAIRAGRSAALLALAVVLLSAAPCLEGNDGIRNSRLNPISPYRSLVGMRCVLGISLGPRALGNDTAERR